VRVAPSAIIQNAARAAPPFAASIVFAATAAQPTSRPAQYRPERSRASEQKQN